MNLEEDVAAPGKENLSPIHVMYRPVIKRRGPGISPGYYDQGPQLLLFPAYLLYLPGNLKSCMYCTAINFLLN